jgi:hypothetical protein
MIGSGHSNPEMIPPNPTPTPGRRTAAGGALGGGPQVVAGREGARMALHQDKIRFGG